MGDDSATFRASLPPIMSAIRAGGDGGVRIQLDVPDTDMAEALRLLLWRDRVMVVTVRPEDESGLINTAEQGCGEERDDMAARPKRKPKWQTT